MDDTDRITGENMLEQTKNTLRIRRKIWMHHSNSKRRYVYWAKGNEVEWRRKRRREKKNKEEEGKK